jgi:hypothetical protein
MAFTKKVIWTLLAVLAVAGVAACGDPGGRGAHEAAPGPDPSAARGGDPAGVLPSRVVHGEVGSFKADGVGPAKILDAAGTLPSHVAPGTGTAPAPGRRTEQVATSGTPPARPHDR